MHQISYSGDTFVTSDDIAAKVLDYARALGQAGSDDTIEIPAVDESGAVWNVQLLIGPASELVSRQVEGDDQDLHADELLAELDRRIASFEGGSHHAVSPDPDAPQDFDPEWDELG
jgi:hypothetical protein